MIKSFLINTDELKRMQAKQRQWSDRPKKGGSAFPTWSFLGCFFFFLLVNTDLLNRVSISSSGYFPGIATLTHQEKLFHLA